MNLKLKLAALLLTTWGAAASAQTSAIQQLPDPKDQAIQQQRTFDAMDAWSKHMEDQYYASLKRSNAHMNCVVNSWHPENCE